MAQVCIEFLAKRKSDISFEEFQNLWTNNHAKLLQELIAKHPGVKGYSVFFNTPALREALKAAGGAAQADFDGSAIITGDSVEALAGLQQDPFYKETVQPHSLKFMDPASVTMRVGHVHDYVRNGSNV